MDPRANVDDEDEKLIRLALSDDEPAWHRLVEKYRVMVYRLAYRVTYHEDDAMDAMQETFTKVATNLRAFRNHGSFRSWISSIAIREAIAVCRKRSHAPEPVEQERLEELLSFSTTHSPDTGPVEQLTRTRQLLQIQNAAGKLSTQQRAILLLNISNDIGPAEIARELQLPANQVRSQLARAIAKLKVLLNPPDTAAPPPEVDTGADYEK